MTVEEGYDAARHCGLNIIATLKEQLGDLDRVEQVIKVRAKKMNFHSLQSRYLSSLGMHISDKYVYIANP